MKESDDINACWDNFVNILNPLCDKYIPQKVVKQNQIIRNFKAPDSLLKFLDLKRKRPLNSQKDSLPQKT